MINLLIDFILISGIVINIIFLFMLINAKKRLLSHRILMLILFLIIAIFIFFYALLHKLKLLFILSFLIEDGSRLLAGPLFYFYVKSIFIKKDDLKITKPHFVPFFVWWLVITLPLAISLYNEHLIFSYLSFFKNSTLPYICHDIILISYLFFSMKMYSQFSNKSKSSHSITSHKNDNWLKKFLVSFFLIISINILIRTGELFNLFNTSWDLGYISTIILIFLTVYLGYNGLKQSSFYLPGFLIASNSINNNNNTKSRNYLNKEDINSLNLKVVEFIEHKKPYLNQELTLSDLALDLNISDKKLSTFINKHLNTSFYDLINSYRVNEFINKINLPEYENQTFEGIAYSCGFNSKSSFYRIFKKITGVSPSEYKKNNTL